MAREVIWSTAALRELRAASEFIASDSPRFASVLIDDAYLTSASLANSPYRGRIVPEIGDGEIREVFLKSYRVIYEVTDERIVVLAFMHGARDLNSLLR